MTNSKKCPTCGLQQYVTAKKRRQAAMISPIIVILMLSVLNLFDLSLFTGIFYGLFLFLLAWTIIPFTYEFTDDEEPLF